MLTLNEIEKLDVSIKEKQTALSVVLNQNPPQTWIKQHPFAKSVMYLPIDKVEYLLTKIYQSWKIEVIEVVNIANAVAVTIRLHVQDRLTENWSFMDGVGATAIQTDKGATANDWSAIKADGVMKALPSAKSYAIKDAAEHLGRIFGRDLNRKDLIGYESLMPANIENAKAIRHEHN